MRFPFWRRQRRDEELEEEIQAHLEMAKRDRIERGATAEEAREAARREFGNVGLVKEVTREMWGWSWLEELGQGLRYGVRMLMKKPGFTFVAVITLALGIGANTAVFSLINAVLLRPLQFYEPERLVMVWEDASFAGFPRQEPAPANYVDWKARQSVFEDMAALESRGFRLTGD